MGISLFLDRTPGRGRAPFDGDETEAAGMRRDSADDQVHPVRQPVAVSASLDQVAAAGQVLQQPAQDGTLLPGYLEALLQLPRGGRVLHFVADEPQQLFVIQHLSHLTAPAVDGRHAEKSNRTPSG